jgi:hypothetical protein
MIRISFYRTFSSGKDCDPHPSANLFFSCHHYEIIYYTPYNFSGSRAQRVSSRFKRYAMTQNNALPHSASARTRPSSLSARLLQSRRTSLATFLESRLYSPRVDKVSTVGPPAITDRKYEKLIKLKKLLDSGVLTQQEFEREKTKILNEP